jgi:hypothetical protein
METDAKPAGAGTAGADVGLRRCPFCGGRTEALHGPDEGGSRCLRCGATGDTSVMIARNLTRQRHEANARLHPEQPAAGCDRVRAVVGDSYDSNRL